MGAGMQHGTCGSAHRERTESRKDSADGSFRTVYSLKAGGSCPRENDMQLYICKTVSENLSWCRRRSCLYPPHQSQDNHDQQNQSQSARLGNTPSRCCTATSAERRSAAESG